MLLQQLLGEGNIIYQSLRPIPLHPPPPILCLCQRMKMGDEMNSKIRTPRENKADFIKLLPRPLCWASAGCLGAAFAGLALILSARGNLKTGYLGPSCRCPAITRVLVLPMAVLSWLLFERQLETQKWLRLCIAQFWGFGGLVFLSRTRVLGSWYQRAGFRGDWVEAQDLLPFIPGVISPGWVWHDLMLPFLHSCSAWQIVLININRVIIKS